MTSFGRGAAQLWRRVGSAEQGAGSGESVQSDCDDRRCRSTIHLIMKARRRLSRRPAGRGGWTSIDQAESRWAPGSAGGSSKRRRALRALNQLVRRCADRCQARGSRGGARFGLPAVSGQRAGCHARPGQRIEALRPRRRPGCAGAGCCCSALVWHQHAVGLWPHDRRQAGRITGPLRRPRRRCPRGWAARRQRRNSWPITWRRGLREVLSPCRCCWRSSSASLGWRRAMSGSGSACFALFA